MPLASLPDTTSMDVIIQRIFIFNVKAILFCFRKSSNVLIVTVTLGFAVTFMKEVVVSFLVLSSD